ncbi:MAG: sigma-70 family RNA polymerase sigma factor [Salinivirgaceae bacterium]|nr:sigma-70 family RNA polymerase sigma factor [Salinivirgaceae bacterium]
MTADEFKIEVFPLKDKLYRFSKRILNDAHEAEDVTQDVLLKLWTMRNELHKYNNLEAFAMTTTKNTSLDKARRKNTRYAKSDDVSYHTDTIDNTDQVENSELGLIIKNAIANLNEPQKTIMHLRDIELYSFEEIEPLVDMNTETIRVNLSRARKKVREEIKKIMSYGTV